MLVFIFFYFLVLIYFPSLSCFTTDAFVELFKINKPDLSPLYLCRPCGDEAKKNVDCSFSQIRREQQVYEYTFGQASSSKLDASQYRHSGHDFPTRVLLCSKHHPVTVLKFYMDPVLDSFYCIFWVFRENLEDLLCPKEMTAESKWNSQNIHTALQWARENPKGLHPDNLGQHMKLRRQSWREKPPVVRTQGWGVCGGIN